MFFLVKDGEERRGRTQGKGVNWINMEDFFLTVRKDGV